jgi:FKBP-type peptidyl-prolyl cis-trans isomerase FkpA
VRIAPSLFLMTALILASCGTAEEPTGPTQLVVEDVTVGTGATAAAGDLVTLHYVGTFLDGRVFDSSVSRNSPFTFRLGTGAVIAGFDQGVTGMRVGGKRRLTIPPNLAYGAQGQGSIPPNATLRFEIDLLSLTR